MKGDGQRIAITGVGLVTALGRDAPTTFRRLVDGTRGFRPVTLFDVSQQRCQIAAEVSYFDVADVAPPGAANTWSRSDALALLAAREALQSAHVEPGRPFALAVGTTSAGLYEADLVLLRGGPDRLQGYGREIVARPLAKVAERLASVFGNVQRRATLCSACSSGALAIVQAAAWLELGAARLVLAGGVDSLSLLTFTGFGVLGAMAVEPCRPFDLDRAGLTLGEGAGFLVLERESEARARQARVIAWLTGWAVGAEAHHITQPEPSGTTACRLLTQAMRRAGIGPDGVDYVNAHGTGTPPNDAMEALALRTSLGDHADRVWVSSNKGQIGHTLGAAGAIEAGVSALALAEARVPPTGGLVNPDPALPLRHVLRQSVTAELRAVLTSSFGFGGTGVVLALEHPQAEDRPRAKRDPCRVVVTGVATWGDRGPLVGDSSVEWLEQHGDAPVLAEPGPSPGEALQALDPNRSRRFDLFAALATAGAEHALGDANADPGTVGMVMGVSHGHVERSVHFLGRAVERGLRLASPAEFPYLLPSMAAGNASVYLGLRGPVLVVSDPDATSESALHAAISLLQVGIADALLSGGVAIGDPVVARAIASLGSGSEQDWNGHAAAWVLLEAASSAAARHALCHAQVIAAVTVDHGADGNAPVEEPRDREQARLVHLGREGPRAEACLARAMAGSAWLEVPRVRVIPPRGGHDAWGVTALAAAVCLLRRGAAREVMVWTAGQHSSSLVQLQALVG
jgi:3-oxoacyl-[acyl-carrier-protein] synthase II